MSERRKICIPLQFLYIHKGNPKDYSIRLMVTPSSNFEPSGKSDIDLVIDSKDSNAKCRGGTRAKQATDKHGTKFQIYESFMTLKYRVPFGHDGLCLKSSLSVQVGCSIKNDYGRTCTRDGGMCHVTLLELIQNKMMCDKEFENYFTFRNVYNSGFNVRESDMNTGTVGVALGDIGMSLFEKSCGFNKTEKWKCVGFLTKPRQNVRDEHFLYVMEEVRHSAEKSEVLPEASEIPNSSAFATLFGKKNRIIPPGRGLGCESVSTLFKDHNRALSIEHDGFQAEVKLSIFQYEEMLKKQAKLVKIVEECTKRMKCPFTPMDTCVWELFFDYRKGYNNHRISHTYDREKIPELDRDKATNVSGCSKTRIDAVVVNHNGDFFKSHVVNMLLSDNKELTGNIGSPFRGGKNGGQSDGLDKKTIPEKRVYLPFFSYIFCQPLAVYKDYWGNALSIMVSRMGCTISEYDLIFFNSYSNSQRAADASKMICNYVQALEYISDYYIPSERETKNREEGDQRKEIEQFWNCLRSLCGDCEDLMLGHYQIYRAFVVHSWENVKINACIESNQVLKEMRRLLACNYITFANIEAVFLFRQKNGEEESEFENSDWEYYQNFEKYKNTSSDGPEHFLYGGVSGDYAEGKYSVDTKGMNSAHAALKLIPKLYFERCVNRSCSRGEKNVFTQGDVEKTEPKSGSCCFYHSHAPDDYNDQLPVLFLEGTSMLTPSDEVEDSCSMERFKKTIFADNEMCEMTKSPIYAVKGKSNFYKASLFGSTPEFMMRHNVATFTFARRKESTGCVQGDHEFVRGVSHHQLSYKSECVVLVPYGGAEIQAPNEGYSFCEHSNMESSKKCNKVNFKGQEINPMMRVICLNELKTRIRARKIKKPTVVNDFKELYIGCEPYNMIIRDTRQNTDQSKILLEAMVNSLNIKHNKHAKIPGTTCGPSNRFLLFVDNYYVTPEFTTRLFELVSEAIYNESFHQRVQLGIQKTEIPNFDGVPKNGMWEEIIETLKNSMYGKKVNQNPKNESCHDDVNISKFEPGFGISVSTAVILESFSEDLKIWRVSFDFDC